MMVIDVFGLGFVLVELFVGLCWVVLWGDSVVSVLCW